jgi:hypothetical protein
MLILCVFSSLVVSSVKAPGSMKRQNSISFDNQPQPSSNRPGTPMDSEAIPTPKPPASVSRGSKVVPDPTLRKGTYTVLRYSLRYSCKADIIKQKFYLFINP